MRNTNKFLALVALVLSITFASCSSNDNEITDEELSEVVMQDFIENLNQIDIPSTLTSSNNTYANQANAQFQTVKLLGTSLAAFFTVPGNATALKSGNKTSSKAVVLNSKTYTWSADGTTIKYTISENSDRYTFSYSITSPNLSGKLMDGYQLKNGSYAEINMYDGTTIESTIKWWLNDNSAKMEIVADDSSVVLESNLKDNSGSIKLYEDAVLSESFIWNSDGTGTYTNHITNQTETW